MIKQKIVGLLVLGFWICGFFESSTQAYVGEITKQQDASEIYGYDMNDNALKYLNESLKFSANGMPGVADREIFLARHFDMNPVFEAKLYQNLGALALKRQQPQQAFLFYQQAVQLTQGDHDAYQLWIDAFSRAIGIKNAEALFLHNFESHPTRPENVYVLGLLYKNQNRIDEAIPFFKAYLSLSPYSILAQSAENALFDLQSARQALVKSPYSQIR